MTTTQSAVWYVTVHGPETWDFEDTVLAALEDAGFPASVERLRRPEDGGLALSFRVSADLAPALAAEQIAAALGPLPVTEALISER